MIGRSRDSELFCRPVDFFRRELPVLLADRINGRRDDKLVDGHGPHKLGHGENGRIVFFAVLPECLPDVRAWIGHVDVAPPDPDARFLETDEGRRLGIMDKDCVSLEAELFSVLSVYLEVMVPHFSSESLFVSLERVMDLFRDVVEFSIARDDFPARVDAEVLEDRNHPVQDLRNASAFTSGVDVQKRSVPEHLAELPEKREVAFRRYSRIRADHVATPADSISCRTSVSTASAMRSRMPSRLCMKGSMVRIRFARSLFSRASSNHVEKSLVPRRCRAS